jgi:hypothetical protein
MNRSLSGCLLLLAALPALAQDLEYVAAMEGAQRARPSQISSTARIAPETEPGTALVVHGRVDPGEKF